MTTRDVYNGIGDYDRMISCISNEESIRHFLRMFLEDENYGVLKEALENDDVQKAFYGAHTLKGSCQNLCLGELYDIDYEVTEALRVGDISGAKERFPELTEAYNRVIDKITRMDE